MSQEIHPKKPKKLIIKDLVNSYLINTVILTYVLWSLCFTFLINRVERGAIDSQSLFLFSGDYFTNVIFKALEFHYLLPLCVAISILVMARWASFSDKEIRDGTGLAALLLIVQSVLAQKGVVIQNWLLPEFYHIAGHVLSACLSVVIWGIALVRCKDEKSTEESLGIIGMTATFIAGFVTSILLSLSALSSTWDISYAKDRGAHLGPHCISSLVPFKYSICKDSWDAIVLSGNIGALVEYYKEYPQRDPVLLAIELIEVYQYTHIHFSEEQWADRIWLPNNYTRNKQTFLDSTTQNESALQSLSVAIKNDDVNNFIQVLKQKTARHQASRFEKMMYYSLR